MSLYGIQAFRKGQRVQVHPATDRWAMGDRYGEVTGLNFSAPAVRVKLDRSGASAWFRVRDIQEIID